MNTRFSLLLLLILLSAALPAQAALVRYDFEGFLPGYFPLCDNELVHCDPDLEPEPDTPFSGSWTVDTAQVGVPFLDRPGDTSTVGMVYDYERFSLTVGGTTIVRGPRPETLFVTTTDWKGRYPDIYTSGYTSGYSGVVAVLDNEELFVDGKEVLRMWLDFSRDGNDLWTDHALPDDTAFFAAATLNRYLGFDFRRSGLRLGTITSLTATTIPLPPMWPASALAVLWLARQRRSAQRMKAL